MNKTQTTIIVLLALVVVALLFYVSKKQGVAPFDSSSTTVATDTASQKMMVGSHAVVMTDQKPGKEVIVSAVVFGNPGFVVIHQDSNGEPGPIIGSSALLGTGETKAFKISLDRQVKDGEKLYVILHLDNGDGKFDASVDTPAETNGDVVMQSFAVSKDVSGQPIDISL